MVIFDELMYLLFPPKCVVCGQLLGKDYKESPICRECRSKLKAEMAAECEFCKKETRECSCVPKTMKAMSPIFYVKLFRYRSNDRDNPANKLIYHMKHSSDAAVYRALAKELAAVSAQRIAEYAEILSKKPLITYVPRSKNSVRKYGHDQGRLIAEAFSKELGIPCEAIVKRRRSFDREMKKLSADERFAEGKNAFMLCNNISADKNTLLIIVDDVITTGASVCSIAEKAKAIGIESFCVISAGRTY